MRLLDPYFSTRRWLTVGLAIGGALAGGAFGIVLTRAGKIVADAPPATVGNYLWNAAVFGLLDDYPTRSGYRITPVVMWLAGDPGDLEPNPHEVASVHVATWPMLGVEPIFLTIEESDRPVIQLPMLGTRIHAPTAAVLYQFRELALHGRTTRVDGLEQPVWAWR